LTAETFKSLRLPVEEFLKLQHTPDKDSLVCTGTQSVEEVINSLIEKATHRLWVVDSGGFPVGVICLTDVCALLKKK